MTQCPHCTGQHDPGALFCPTTGKAISVSRIQKGTLIDGKYRIVCRVASGGMGAVYEVVHERIRRKLAMKFILPELAANEEVRKRFEIEARAASAIGQENIVEITDMGTTSDGLPFLVMEFLEGFDLAVLLEKGAVDQVRTVHIVSQVLSALEAAHERQIIHRDLKPENVFLIERGGDPDFVKLLDFGISKFAGGEEAKLHLTSTGLILGTPYYMSPEQARGDRKIDQRSDLFSVGVILYQLLTGKRPFAADNLNQLLYQITSGQLTAPREHTPDISLPLERVVQKALAHEAKHRFQSASEFRAALVGNKQLSTREMPPARVSTDRMRVRGAFQPTLADTTDTGVDPAARGTPLAWTGERNEGRATSNRGLLWAGIAGLVVVVAVVTVVLTRAQRPGPARNAPAAPAAAMTSPVPMSATMQAPLVMHIPNETIRLTLRLDPADARVSLDGKPVTTTSIQLPRGVTSHKLRVEAKGYVTQDFQITPTSDQTLVINLKQQSTMRHRRRRRMRPAMRPAMRPVMRIRPVGMKQIRAITDI
jgi:serine/threonine-protein kinase